jgi:F-type H+-transporting ATPase subunit gamma
MTQELVQKTLLPLQVEPAQARRLVEYAFEPSADAVFVHLLPRYIKNMLWLALLESKAAELAARMQAMGNATENAAEFIQELTLRLNRARQATITREISELVGGAEAINA